ncbi:hypothetical protein ED733_001123 [Metarhizium rileyi]|uniref:DUF8035 domain-containing protein n=1 Tax=Metarhizium rileyi (strain RCEF 4871) TaxID=1649241 RepID=A0A5C6G1Y0_METRR|nr:hypothetical protein ED733_001123 [Metarhizium rileyi]
MANSDYPLELASGDWAYVSTTQLLSMLTYTHRGQLPPDSQGNTIPRDAVWTRINRRLMSVELLQKAGVRYEAREEFVAILGAVTGAQIVELVEYSTVTRQHRSGFTHGERCQSAQTRSNTRRSARCPAASKAESDDDVREDSRFEYKYRNKDKVNEYQATGSKQDLGPGDTTGCSGSRPQDSRLGTSKMASPSRSTKGELAVTTLSIVGSVASVVSLAKDLWKSS